MLSNIQNVYPNTNYKEKSQDKNKYFICIFFYLIFLSELLFKMINTYFCIKKRE